MRGLNEGELFVINIRRSTKYIITVIQVLLPLNVMPANLVLT